MDNNFLNFIKISKSYKDLEVLKNITFSIPKNSIFGILGENGSGKSTFMKILTGLIKNWTGDIYFLDKSISSNNLSLKKDFGYLIESPSFYEYLTARKNLEILSRISNQETSRIDQVLEVVNLIDRSEDKVSNYSYGMKQRLGIAQAILHDPKVLILDEPNNGLDPNGNEDMMNIIKRLRDEGKTICLSTHNLNDVENICTHFTIFKNGKNSKISTINEQLLSSNRWVINVKDVDRALKTIKKSNQIEFSTHFNNNISFYSKYNDITITEILAIFNGITINKIIKDSNLIDYFK